jgi:hypothetical protein
VAIYCKDEDSFSKALQHGLTLPMGVPLMLDRPEYDVNYHVPMPSACNKRARDEEEDNFLDEEDVPYSRDSGPSRQRRGYAEQRGAYSGQRGGGTLRSAGDMLGSARDMLLPGASSTTTSTAPKADRGGRPPPLAGGSCTEY